MCTHTHTSRHTTAGGYLDRRIISPHNVFHLSRNNNVGKPAFEFGPAVNVPVKSLENLGLVFVLPEGGHHKPGGSAAGRQSVTLGFCF